MTQKFAQPPSPSHGPAARFKTVCGLLFALLLFVLICHLLLLVRLLQLLHVLPEHLLAVSPAVVLGPHQEGRREECVERVCAWWAGRGKGGVEKR